MNKGYLLIILSLLLLFTFIGFYVYIIITYGNKPISEVPAWVYWFMQRKGR